MFVWRELRAFRELRGVAFPLLLREGVDPAHYRRFVNSSNIISGPLAPGWPQRGLGCLC